jgi:hypothetical protein
MRCELFLNVTVKINRSEAEAACRRAFGEVDYERLRRHVCGRNLFVTDGTRGTAVLEEGRKFFAPARVARSQPEQAPGRRRYLEIWWPRLRS